MGHAIRAGLAIAVILSVAAILITPTCSDDVDAVLHHQFQILHPAFTAGAHIGDSLANLLLWVGNLDSPHLHFTHLVDLLCARLC